jgi:hypothetical protein
MDPSSEAPPTLLQLGFEPLVEVCLHLNVASLTSLVGTCRQFQDVPPDGSMTLTEATLRRRAQARGRSLPLSLPEGVDGWAQFLVLLQRREDAEHHAIAAGYNHSYVVDENGALRCCGAEGANDSGLLGLGDFFGGFTDYFSGT